MRSPHPCNIFLRHRHLLPFSLLSYFRHLTPAAFFFFFFFFFPSPPSHPYSEASSPTAEEDNGQATQMGSRYRIYTATHTGLTEECAELPSSPIFDGASSSRCRSGQPMPINYSRAKKGGDGRPLETRVDGGGEFFKGPSPSRSSHPFKTKGGGERAMGMIMNNNGVILRTLYKGTLANVEEEEEEAHCRSPFLGNE